MTVIYILSRDNGPAYLALTPSLSYIVAAVADLPINTETLSSMTKHMCVLARPNTLAEWNGGSTNNIN